MKMHRIIALVALLLTVTTSNSFAWGHKGHTVVAETAFHYMDASTRKNVLNYLDGMSLEDAGNWMDAIKSDPANDYMKPYHYIDIEKGAKQMPAGENIVTVLQRTLKELDHKQNLSRDEIKTRILYLFHLIGDLGQPLHIGYPGDKGGNDVKILFLGRSANLHSVWDTDIIENQHIDLAAVLKDNTYTDSEFAAKQKIDVFAWAGQTRSFLKNAYDIGDDKINDFYIAANAKIIKHQLLDSGIRLAAVLDHYFKEDL